MSNLSEEEIIIDAKEFINNIKEILNEGNNDLTKKVETDFYTLQVVLQGLLDLYQQEKEKNKEYERQLDLDYIDNNYISKDKIRERIKELEELRDENADEIKRNVRFYSIYDSYNLQINELQDLLLEEE